MKIITWNKKWKRGLLIALIVYLLGGLALYFFQEKFIFHPVAIANEAPLNISAPHEEIRVPVDADKTIHITRFTVSGQTVRGAVLYFHGNAGNVEYHADAAPLLTSLGYEVWMPDYPGYGKSTGPRSEAILQQDAELVFKLLRARFAADSIIIYGQSLGSGPATWLASRVDCGQLILQSPFSNLPDLMRRYAPIYPMGWLAKYQFNNAERLPEVDAPITIIHGTDDRIIPIRFGRRLANAAPGRVHMIELEGAGHNDMLTNPEFESSLGDVVGDINLR